MDTDNSESPPTDGTSFPTPDEPVAQLTQGVAYCWGDEVARDVAKGVELIREAISKGVEKVAEQGNAEAQNALADCYYYGWCVNEDYAEAAKWYRLAAEQGHDGAQYKLGKCYDAGCGVSKDAAEAARWFRLAAEQEHAEAQCRLGACYLDGIGVEKDEKQAVTWFLKAADAGNTDALCELAECSHDGRKSKRRYRRYYDIGDAMYDLAMRYRDGDGVEKKLEKFVEWMEKAVAAGKRDTKIMLELGKCYLNGVGVKKDARRAVKWFREATSSMFRNPDAGYELGKCYRDGIGVGKDEERAASWFRRAADHGDVGAMFELGKCYLDGIGVGKDEVRAAEWLCEAADMGNTDAKELLQKLDPEKAAQLYQMAAKTGDTGAMLELGKCYLDGRGVERDEAQAAKWLCKAADEGDTKVKELLQKLDPERVVKLYQLAAKAGYTYAMYHLAVCYRDGIGVNKDEKRTVYWFRKAVLYGSENPDAIIGLAKCYLNGIGVEKDEIQAEKWFQKAAEKKAADRRKRSGVYKIVKCYTLKGLD